eukprot:TRINITY_DN2835_c0_g1_i2.p1 TRINITY_DN2835_c0_g1~~TRINITY_DN2835_c0_g1_i2.p1  ORF type:complete len:342 (-),score=64.02 TRINITY_DN2835_c0_g1_i2:146-1171(-)
MSQKDDISQITLLRAPLKTLSIFMRVTYHDLIYYFNQFYEKKVLFYGSVAFAVGLFVLYNFVPGVHVQYLDIARSEMNIMLWWVGLGVLSSVGLGTGLHTFVLYLGPWIAQVTMAATECRSLYFETYGDDKFLCPEGVAQDALIPSYLEIYIMVWFEAFLWGAGTAIGELPPYFVAYSHRRSGKNLREVMGEDEDEGTISMVFGWFQNKGPIGKSLLILAFASIPNPLFDLAGLISGYLMLPFLQFFLPTLIGFFFLLILTLAGKAVIKVSIQVAFIILIFNTTTLEYVIGVVGNWLPFLKEYIQNSFDQTRSQFHRNVGEEVVEQSVCFLNSPTHLTRNL